MMGSSEKTEKTKLGISKEWTFKSEWQRRIVRRMKRYIIIKIISLIHVLEETRDLKEALVET